MFHLNGRIKENRRCNITKLKPSEMNYEFITSFKADKIEDNKR